jgi:hypothetical protein
VQDKLRLAQGRILGWFIVLALFIGCGQVFAAGVTLSWTQSSSPDVTGYNIYYGTASGVYTSKIMVGNVTTATISNLNCGTTYYFSATTLDSNGDESGFSNETLFIVPGMLALSTGVNPGDPMVIKFPVSSSHWYEVQATVDFKSWATIWQTDVATSNTWVQFSDPNASAYASRFYRLAIH